MLQIVVVIRIMDQAKVHVAVQNDPNFNDLELRVICWNTSNRMHWQIFANIIYLLALFLMHIFQCKVRTFRESHKIWKNLPQGFDKSGDLLSKSHDLSKPRGRFFSNFVWFSESPNFTLENVH